GGGLQVNERDIRVIVTAEVRDGGEKAFMGRAADIQLTAGGVYNVCQGVHGGHFLCLINQIDEQFFFHDIGVHEDIPVFGVSAILLDRENAFLLVQIQSIAGK